MHEWIAFPIIIVYPKILLILFDTIMTLFIQQIVFTEHWGILRYQRIHQFHYPVLFIKNISNHQNSPGVLVLFIFPNHKNRYRKVHLLQLFQYSVFVSCFYIKYKGKFFIFPNIRYPILQFPQYSIIQYTNCPVFTRIKMLFGYNWIGYRNYLIFFR